MSVLLIRLNDSSFEEAEEIRELLELNAIDYYETSSGKWGLSVEAIWLHDDLHLPQAQQLLSQYQQQRTTRMHAEYQQLKAEGNVETIVDRLKQHPFLFLMTVLMMAFIAYISIKPFLSFID